ncbi:MAG: elongation factor G, partial [Dehalococcoidales bacterium]|nr:elongation factor G [Dehalococcoidales bacterium]
MNQYHAGSIRNVVIMGHGSEGKTSLVEAICFNSGAINRLGKVDNGTSVSDFDPDEIKRKLSINLSLLPVEWEGIKINFIDSPGYPDFLGDVKSAARVCEGAVIVLAANSDVKTGTEIAWDLSKEENLSRIFFVSKMERENADFFKVKAEIQEKFGNNCLPIQIPVGSQADFKGVIDLISGICYTGTERNQTEIPAELKDRVAEEKEKLVEAIAETDDDLIEKYLAGETISSEALTLVLVRAIKSGAISPIMCGSGLANIGAIDLMNAIKDLLPSPEERDIKLAETSTIKELKANETGPLAALVFKTSADPYVGKLSMFRVYSGHIDSNSQVWNVNQGANERIGQLFIPRGKSQESVPHIAAGDIGAVAKLAVTATGDTLGDQSNPAILEPVIFPSPCYSVAVYPHSKEDVDKLGSSLARIVEEDPTMNVSRDPDTGETILSGLGDTQVEVAAERMHRKFGVGVDLKTPKVAYKETISHKVTAEHKHKKQSGGHGQYGHVMMELEPLPRGSGNEFATRIVGGSIPKNYLPAVEKGVMEAVKEGVLAGCPVVDVRATAYDGSFHPVDSSEICFKIAGSQAFKKGMTAANPILLEPIMNLKVVIPGDYTGDVVGDLNTKRARVNGITPEGDMNIIEAQVPL